MSYKYYYLSESGKNVMTLLKKLVVENHSAILVVTHDHRMVEGFDRIFQINDGRINDEKSNVEAEGIDGLE